MTSDVGSSFDKLPPGKSETLLGPILNRTYKSQASGAEKCDWYVLTCCIAAIFADRMTNTFSIVPDDVRGSVCRNRHPGSVIKTLFRQGFPRPRRTFVLADANGDATAFIHADVEAHRYRVKSVVPTDGQIHVRLANRAICFAADTDSSQVAP